MDESRGERLKRLLSETELREYGRWVECDLQYKKEHPIALAVLSGCLTDAGQRTLDELLSMEDSWIDQLVGRIADSELCFSLYCQQLSIRYPEVNEYGVTSWRGRGELSKYEGVVLTSDKWTQWMNTWWSIYYVLDDGAEIFGKNGEFVKQLTREMACGPVIMVTQDNDNRSRTMESLKLRNWPIDERKLIGYWRNLDDWVPARFEDVSRPNPFKSFPGKNRKRQHRGTIVNLTRLIRGDFDDHGVGHLYHVKIHTGARTVFKVGLTKTSVRDRFSGTALPAGWTVEELGSISGHYAVMAIAEQAALIDNDAHVLLKQEFGGKSECRGKPFDIDFEQWGRTSLEDAKELAVAAQYRSFL